MAEGNIRVGRRPWQRLRRQRRRCGRQDDRALAMEDRHSEMITPIQSRAHAANCCCPHHPSLLHNTQQTHCQCCIICTTVCTSTSVQLRTAGPQGPTTTLTAALKRLIKQLLGTYFTIQVKYYKRKKTKKSIFSMLFLKTFKDVKFSLDGSAF